MQVSSHNSIVSYFDFIGFSKLAVKSMSAHFEERLYENNRGNVKDKKKFLGQMKQFARRLNANPGLIEAVGTDGKTYKATEKAVRALPNQLGVKFPGVNGYVIFENRAPDPSKMSAYTLNTLLDKNMDVRKGTVIMSEQKLMQRLIPEIKPIKSPKKKPPRMTADTVARDFGFKGPGWKGRFDSAVKEIGSKTKNLNAAREALGDSPLPSGSKIRSIKPGSRPNIKGMSANKTRRLTRAVLSLASKGRIKLGSASEPQFLARLRAVLIRRYQDQGASSNLG